MNPLLELKHVNKEYQAVKAVNDVSFKVPAGCIFGLLGPNGAGKTSMIRIITGITRADSGEVLLNGTNTLNIKDPSIGYMPEERGLYKKMKVGEQLIYLCRLRGFSKADAEKEVVQWMRKFEIENWWNKKVEELSKGMSQKIQFIATVVHRPKLIILDEPFSGLDPINSNLIKDEIINLKNQGSSILFSTHRMEQVEEMCEEIVLINKGKIILDGKVLDIRERFKENKFEIITSEKISDSIIQKYNLVEFAPLNYSFQIQDLSIIKSRTRELLQEDISLRSFKELLPTFNQLFIQIVNQSNHE
ncbi:MAG TPA: ATP-binding cassette domain-containing protein [Saprospiraceae bacterium]|jgi:ABC-2 type transport system ATP-binding protein|nr:ATP-binding cassette domain-containing protein [Saprospiraceae bacterium]HUN15363.1 ATP-binding cassette domain-containing protein [Saprospiraceae bacterium]